MDQPLAQSAPFVFDNSYARELEGFYVRLNGAKAPSPRIELYNDRLATELGLNLDPENSKLAAIFAGSEVAEGSEPLAQAYAGHQFGGFSPQLGDGRALLLGEVLDTHGERRDLHLKGSGPTPFSRGGDGKAVLGPVLREYLMGEAMHALGIPTTRALAVVTTGEQVARTVLKPGAVLVRVAASHLRVGTFQFFAARQDWEKIRQLADYAIARHDPDLVGTEGRYLAFFRSVMERQARLVAQWMAVGFIHGVMNTDNMAISGETIDYGPCAFMDEYDLKTVFSSIDRHGRYAYGNQPKIAQWNLARLAEPLIPLIAPDDQDKAVNLATDILAEFNDCYKLAWLEQIRDKIGLSSEQPDDDALIREMFDAMSGQAVDFTLFFRTLSSAVEADKDTLPALFEEREKIQAWLPKWRDRLRQEGRSPDAVAAGMDAINPLYIPRNHIVEDVLQKAEEFGDMKPASELLELLRSPYERRDGFEAFEKGAPAGAPPHMTFCGT